MLYMSVKVMLQNVCLCVTVECKWLSAREQVKQMRIVGLSKFSGQILNFWDTAPVGH